MSTPPFFGTDGIRGNAATSRFLTDSFLTRLGAALATWAQTKTKTSPVILIARDTRASGNRIERALRRGIASAGGKSVIAGITPTPALVSIVRGSGSYAAGIMITASHNTAQDNGLKICTPQGKLTPHEEEELSELLVTTPQTLATCTPRASRLPALHALLYRSRIASFFPPNPLSGMTIALDCAHGAAFQLAPHIFTDLGARVITMGVTPNGKNINHHCGSVHPPALQAFMQRHRADVGFAFDGDGDRVVAVSSNGEIKTGDDLLALLATHPRFANAKGIVGTVMSNEGLATHLQNTRRKLIRTPVGDKHVLAALYQHNIPLGGEPSGHLLVPSYLPTADGIFSAILAAHTLLLTTNTTFKTFSSFAQTSISLPVSEKHDLTHAPYDSILEAFQKSLGMGRSVVRYSGTEPVLRIMVEHPNAATAALLATSLERQLQAHLAPPHHNVEKPHVSLAV